MLILLLQMTYMEMLHFGNNVHGVVQSMSWIEEHHSDPSRSFGMDRCLYCLSYCSCLQLGQYE